MSSRTSRRPSTGFGMQLCGQPWRSITSGPTLSESSKTSLNVYCPKKRKKKKGHLVCFTIELVIENYAKNQVHQISFCRWLRLKFMILTPFSSKKRFTHSVFFDWDTQTSIWGVSSSRISDCSASLRQGLDQVVNHLHLDGRPLLLECLKQLTHICRGVSLWIHLSNLFQVCLFRFKSGDMEGQGRIWT